MGTLNIRQKDVMPRSERMAWERLVAQMERIQREGRTIEMENSRTSDSRPKHQVLVT